MPATETSMVYKYKNTFTSSSKLPNAT